MKEIPILFSTPMVQRILGGSKGVTRRIIKAKSKKAVGFYIISKLDGSNKYPHQYDENERMIDAGESLGMGNKFWKA